VFEWEEEIVATITDIAYEEGYEPFEVKADLETVEIIARGDLASNEKWRMIKESIDLGDWETVAYVRFRDDRPFIFGMTRKFNKQIKMPKFGELSNEELFEEIMGMRRMIEKALECDVRQYCFPEKSLRTIIS